MGVLDKPLAVEIVNRHLRDYPVDVHAMASEIGLRIEERMLPDSISGKISKDWWGDYTITVNDRHSATRQRFTVAHEIAHYILHRDLIENGIVDNEMYRDHRIGDEREYQANSYAASILMPHWLVRKAWMKGLRDARSIARAFDVSTAVAEIRIKELGCANWP